MTLVLVLGVGALLMLAIAGVCEWLDDHPRAVWGAVWWLSFALTWVLVMAERRPRLSTPPLGTPTSKGW